MLREFCTLVTFARTYRIIRSPYDYRNEDKHERLLLRIRPDGYRHAAVSPFAKSRAEGNKSIFRDRDSLCRRHRAVRCVGVYVSRQKEPDGNLQSIELGRVYFGRCGGSNRI